MTRYARFSDGRALSLGAVATVIVTAGFALTGSAAAASTRNTITSRDWSGYAAHGSTTKFRSVSGRWRVPAATCVDGEQTFSAFWVGIGGYDLDSDALEQDGIELDCNADGVQSVSAWYELLPAGPHTVRMTVHSGDLIAASVHHDGDAVTLEIDDLTREESFSKIVHDRNVDDTSAEWIAEAPEDCASDNDCTVLPLSDFGTVRFSDATVTTVTGITSGVSSKGWTTTKLLLGYEKQGSAFVARSSGGSATPSALGDRDREFEVTWSGTQPTTTSGASGSTGSTGSSGSSDPSAPSGPLGSAGSSGPGGTLNPAGGGDSNQAGQGGGPGGGGSGSAGGSGGSAGGSGGSAGGGSGPGGGGGGPGQSGGPGGGAPENFRRLP